MDSIKQKLLDKVSRMELAANRAIKCSEDPELAQEPVKIIPPEQCNWTLQDCRAFREMINECFGALTEDMINIDKALFKQLFQLVFNLPDLGSQLAAINVNTSATATGEMLVSLEPSELLLRLNAALRACG